jgi:hypothetical protein
MRDRFTPAMPNVDARRHELALALHDLATTRREVAQHRRRELLDLSHPVAHRAQRTHGRRSRTAARRCTW